MPPPLPGPVLIVRVEHAVPALTVGGALGNAREFVPPRIVVIVVPVGQPPRPPYLSARVEQEVFTLKRLAFLSMVVDHVSRRIGPGFAFVTSAKQRRAAVVARSVPAIERQAA